MLKHKYLSRLYVFDFLSHGVFRSDIFHRRDRSAGKYEPNLIGADNQRDDIILNGPDRAVYTANGTNSIARFQGTQHGFYFFVAPALRDNHDGKHGDHEQNQDTRSLKKRRYTIRHE